MKQPLKALNQVHNRTPLGALLDLSARIALVAIFLLAGVNKIQYYDGNAAYMASAGLPEILLPAVIAFELLAGLAILIGFQTRLVALAIAGFTLLTALMFHLDFSDQMQFLMFWKNVAIAGGFLVLAANGAGRLSLDARNA
jgi:putative oxidoreductase